MECAEMFTIMARCFSPTTQDEWNTITSNRTWGEFLVAMRYALQDAHALAEQQSSIARIHATCPLQDFLAATEINALFEPPTFEEKEIFASKHFAPEAQGSSEAALPVESLYLSWNNAVCSPFSHRSGLPGSSTVHMYVLAQRNNLKLPASLLGVRWDHLAVELSLIAKLFEEGKNSKALLLIRERLGWLTAYRRRLMALNDAAVDFFVALVDALMGIWVQIEPMEVAS